MKDRIKEIIKYTGLNSASFAEELGIQKSSISHIVNGRNNPSVDFIMKLTNRYPEINSRWLISGEGEMISGENKTASSSAFSSDSGDLFSGNYNIHKTVVSSKPQKVDTIITDTQKSNNKGFLSNISSDKVSENSSKEKIIEKVLIFYTDGTFKEFSSAN